LDLEDGELRAAEQLHRRRRRCRRCRAQLG
jgi:hypothetical protein